MNSSLTSWAEALGNASHAIIGTLFCCDRVITHWLAPEAAPEHLRYERQSEVMMPTTSSPGGAASRRAIVPSDYRHAHLGEPAETSAESASTRKRKPSVKLTHKQSSLDSLNDHSSGESSDYDAPACPSSRPARRAG